MTVGILDVPVRVPISLSTPVKRNPREAAVFRLDLMRDILLMAAPYRACIRSGLFLMAAPYRACIRSGLFLVAVPYRACIRSAHAISLHSRLCAAAAPLRVRSAHVV